MSTGRLSLYFQVKMYQLKEQMKVTYLFYRNWRFAILDLTFLLCYIFHNPYRISKKFYQKKGEKEVHLYGETPLTSLQKILKIANLTKSDRFIELGSGRGRGCFFISHFIGCPTTGIEWISHFHNIAHFIKKLFRCNNCTFIHQDILDIDLSKNTCLYLYGICFKESFLQTLVKNIEKMPSQSKIISISFPLTDYSSSFQIIESFPLSFNWGKTTAFLQIKL